MNNDNHLPTNRKVPMTSIRNCLYAALGFKSFLLGISLLSLPVLGISKESNKTPFEYVNTFIGTGGPGQSVWKQGSIHK